MTDDAVVHVVWYKHFAKQFWEGDLYPRWLQGMNGGLGSPTFYYYGSVPYHLTSLISPLFTRDPDGWYQLGISASLAVIASGIGAYIWLSSFANRRAALVAAILYMALPYHLAIDLYSRSALGELWAFVWLPVILYFASTSVRSVLLRFVGLAVSYALLIMTHLPTTLIFSTLPPLYAFFVAGEQHRVKATYLTISGMALGSGLAAIYLLPAMLTQDFISLETMRAGDLNYRNWFLFSALNWRSAVGPEPDFIARKKLGLTLSTAVAMGLILCSYVLVLSRSKTDAKINGSLFWFVTGAASVFMITPFSLPIWQTVTALQAIQFPYRFNVVLAVATTALCAIGVSSVKRQDVLRIDSKSLAIALMSVFVLASMVFTTWRVWRAFPSTNSNLQAQRALKEGLNGVRISQGPSEHQPKWAPWNNTFLQRIKSYSESSAQTNVVEGTGSVNVHQWSSQEIILEVDSLNNLKLVVNQFYYPLWVARFVSNPRYLAVQPSQPEGLVSVTVPGGKHTLSLSMNRSTPEIVGQVVSAVSAVIILCLLASNRVRNSPKRVGVGISYVT